MQTFLPHRSFGASASALDSKRLGKQRVETMQIMMALVDNGGLRGGWTKHPASRMWHGHLGWLMAYQDAFCREWTEIRGFRDSCWRKTLANLSRDEQGLRDWKNIREGKAELVDRPWFLDSPALRQSHRDNLVRKAPETYLPLFGPLRSDLSYPWTESATAELAAELRLPISDG